MTTLLGIRSALGRFYGEHEVIANVILKFLMSIAAYIIITYYLGYNEALKSVLVVIVLALISSILPVGATIFISAALIVVHLLSLHWEAAAITAAIFIVILFMYFRFAPKHVYHSLLTPVFFGLGVPAIMPVSAGLLRSPSSIVSVACGTVVFYYLRGISQNASLIAGTSETVSSQSIVGIVLKQLYGNVDMYIVVAIFVATAAIVYLIRRTSINNSWSIAITAGVIFNLMTMLVYYVLTETVGKIIPLAIGEAITFIVCLALELFVFNLDYTRVERVQFEDDDYYYYVKAIPKRYVSEKKMEVKTFNRVDSKDGGDNVDEDTL